VVLRFRETLRLFVPVSQRFDVHQNGSRPSATGFEEPKLRATRYSFFKSRLNWRALWCLEQ
jgi:hypothetical protein